jgi:hypothetical protein
MTTAPRQEPGWRELPVRTFSEEFLALRARAYDRIEDYYDRDHLARAADWIVALEPNAPETLILAALTHDLERSVPGGAVLDKASDPWDVAYNRAHCERSAVIVSDWLRESGASDRFVAGVRRPIREHEFGGSPAGDLMQAADSISFLETNATLVSTWFARGECNAEKAEQKLRWMFERIRLERARPIARPYYDRSIEELRRVAAGEVPIPPDPGRAPGA